VRVLERLRAEHLLVLGALAALVAGALLFGTGRRATEDEESARAGESRSALRTGSLALARTLARLGASVEAHERRSDLLREDHAVLVSISAPEEWDEEERRALSDWMGDGGTLLWLPRREGSDDMLKMLGLERRPAPDGATEARVDFRTMLGRLPRDQRLRSTGAVRLGPTPVSGARALASDEHGWLAAWVPTDEGGAVVLADEGCARNDRLLEADNAAILVAIAMHAAGGGVIAFDEYHHGHTGGESPLAWLHTTRAWPVLWHAAAIGFLILLGTRRRLGPPRLSREEKRRRPAEFVEAFARLAAASRATGLAVELVLGHLTDTAQRRLGASDAETLAREAARRGRDPQAVRGLLSRARAAARGRPPARAMVRIVRDLERLRRDVLPDREAW
jgi:hypothetical protein